jgi:hypothetical protein
MQDRDGLSGQMVDWPVSATLYLSVFPRFPISQCNEEIHGTVSAFRPVVSGVPEFLRFHY